MKKAYRHGELLFVQIDNEKLPDEVKGAFDSTQNLVSDSINRQIIATGSHGNHHTVTGANLYLHGDGEYVIGYLKAKKDNKLFHPEHSPNGCSLPVGFYEIRIHMEHTHEGMKEVID